MKPILPIILGTLLTATASQQVSAATVIDFESFNNGDNITSIDYGFGTALVRAMGGIDEAWVYDTNNTSNDDPDLFATFDNPNTPHDEAFDPGNVLIIQEALEGNDNGVNNPDDNAGGGSILFIFENELTLHSIDIFDIPLGDTTITAYDESRSEVGSWSNSYSSENSGSINYFETIDLGQTENARALLITMEQSGAIDNLTISPVPEPSTYALMLGGLGLVGFMARRRKK